MDPADATVNTAARVGLPEFEHLRSVFTKGAESTQVCRRVSPLCCADVFLANLLPSVSLSLCIALRCRGVDGERKWSCTWSLARSLGGC
jgi:hypothetical protein